jgi:hypothetical protein
MSVFNLVDLTGSERVTKSGLDESKVLLKEGAMINKSLVTLGLCIRELGKFIFGGSKGGWKGVRRGLEGG